MSFDGDGGDDKCDGEEDDDDKCLMTRWGWEAAGIDESQKK